MYIAHTPICIYYIYYITYITSLFITSKPINLLKREFHNNVKICIAVCFKNFNFHLLPFPIHVG